MKTNVLKGKKMVLLIAAAVILVAAVAAGIALKKAEEKKYSDPANWPVLKAQDVFPEDMTLESYNQDGLAYIDLLGSIGALTPSRTEVVSIKFETSRKCPGDYPWIVDEADDSKMLAWDEWLGGGRYVLHIWSKYGVRLPEDCSFLFAGYPELTSIDFGDRVDASLVKNMYGMFLGCTKLQSLDLSGFDTSHVTNMSGMFDRCHSLSSVDVSHFVTSNVTDMALMFNECESLTSLDVSNFDTRNVTNMTAMFRQCEKLPTLDLRYFDTHNVTDMTRMFQLCSGLTTLNLSNFNTSNVTGMYGMFAECKSLRSLDVRSFDTGKVASTQYMFAYCPNLATVTVSDKFVAAPYADGIFEDTLAQSLTIQ